MKKSTESTNKTISVYNLTKYFGKLRLKPKKDIQNLKNMMNSAKKNI